MEENNILTKDCLDEGSKPKRGNVSVRTVPWIPMAISEGGKGMDMIKILTTCSPLTGDALSLLMTCRERAKGNDKYKTNYANLSKLGDYAFYEKEEGIRERKRLLKGIAELRRKNICKRVSKDRFMLNPEAIPPQQKCLIGLYMGNFDAMLEEYRSIEDKYSPTK